jgi:hypothetical protein
MEAGVDCALSCSALLPFQTSVHCIQQQTKRAALVSGPLTFVCLCCSVPPGRQPTVTIAGMDRGAVAPAVLVVGGAAGLWTGAVGSLSLGLILGTALVGAHATFRTPNLKAKLSNYHTTDLSRP